MAEARPLRPLRPPPPSRTEARAVAGGAPWKIWYPPGRLPGEGLEIRGLGWREGMGAGLVDRPRGTGDWLFMAFPQPVELLVDGAPREMAGPRLMAWSPDQGHYYGWRHGPWAHSWIHAHGAALDALAGSLALPRALPVAIPMTALETCVDGLRRELERPDPDPALARLHLELLVREIVRAAAAAPASAPPPWPEIRRFIEEHMAQRITLGGLARRFRRSPQHLCEGFHRWFGAPPIEYLIRLRLDRARVLLTDRNRTVAEVAAAVGWHDAPHFTRLFRRRCGVSPRDLRG